MNVNTFDYPLLLFKGNLIGVLTTKISIIIQFFIRLDYTTKKKK